MKAYVISGFLLRNIGMIIRLKTGKPLEGFHSPDGLKWQYTHGVQDVSKISPDNWND